jgi:hypothetical protein
MSELKNVIADFTAQLTALINAQATAQARSVVLNAFGAGDQVPKRRGRPPKALGPSVVPVLAKKARKKAPIQLCPVPGCKNPAAPVFGMVCAKHKDLPKAKIRKFREARKAKKLGLKSSTGPKRRTRKTAAKAARSTKGAKAPEPQKATAGGPPASA